jgi:hypothetical protein
VFKDYSELADPLKLPINGKTYTVSAVGLADGIKLMAVFSGEEDAPTIPDEEFNRILLGSAYEEMLADNVPGPAVVRAALTALADFQKGRATAEILWETGGDPKALTAWMETNSNREQRRAKTGASTTPRRASGSSRKKTPAS